MATRAKNFQPGEKGTVYSSWRVMHQSDNEVKLMKNEAIQGGTLLKRKVLHQVLFIIHSVKHHIQKNRIRNTNLIAPGGAAKHKFSYVSKYQRRVFSMKNREIWSF